MNNWNAQPIYFGPPSRALFGWLHRPPAAVVRSDVGLVLCNAFGFDAISSHRALRHVASAATQLGVSCIRFDYDGTGDSVGDDFDSDRVAAWMGSIHAAADELKSRTGVTRLCLLGIRMGGLLAAAAAQQRSDICGLALIFPTVNPRSYLREMRAFHVATLNPQPGDLGDGDDSMTECVGFLMTGETTRALEKLSCTGSGPPPRDVLILDREDLPNARALAEQLGKQEARVVYLPTSEYQALLKSPSPLQLPEHILKSFRDWMQQLPALHDLPQAASSGSEVEKRREARTRIPWKGSDEADLVLEEVAAPAGSRGGFSITTLLGGQPPVHAGTGRRCGVLLVNSGAVHHVGPSRMYVALARQWAGMGYVVMRVDLSGIGDSPALPGAEENVVYSDHAADDVIAAISQLKDQFQVTEVVSLGVCSGAYHSFVVAKKGAALKGIILINPLTFYWMPGDQLDEGDLSPRAAVAALETQRYGKSVRKWSTWKKFFTGKADLGSFVDSVMRHAIARLGVMRRDARRLAGMSIPNDLPRDLRHIDRRGIRTVMVFGGADPALPRLRNLGGNALRRLVRRRVVELHVIEGADHTFMQLKHRRVLQRMLSDRVRDLLSG